MVDSIKGPGAAIPASNIKPLDQTRERRKTGEAASAAPRDEVHISAKALDQQQAETAAKDARVILEKSGHALGLDPTFAVQA